MRVSLQVAVCTAVLFGLWSNAASAMTCTFDEQSRTVTGTLDPTESALLQTTGDGHLSLTSTGDPGGWCEQHTVNDTDAVRLSGQPGTSEHVSIYESLHPLAPGATPERGSKKRTLSEIEVFVDLKGADEGFTYDSLSLDAGPGSDFIALGSDGLALNRDADADITIAGTPRLQISGHEGSDEITGQGGFGTGLPYVSDEPLTIYGGDSYNGSAEPDVLTGGDGVDQLHGGSANDTLRGMGGGDALWGFGGDDTVSGGDGADTLGGDYGSDHLSGDGGDDSLHGGSEPDVLDGGDGNDMLTGDGDADTYRAGPGNDTLTTDDSFADALIDGGDGDDLGFLDRWDTAVNVETVYVY